MIAVSIFSGVVDDTPASPANDALRQLFKDSDDPLKHFDLNMIKVLALQRLEQLSGGASQVCNCILYFVTLSY